MTLPMRFQFRPVGLYTALLGYTALISLDPSSLRSIGAVVLLYIASRVTNVDPSCLIQGSKSKIQKNGTQ